MRTFSEPNSDFCFRICSADVKFVSYIFGITESPFFIFFLMQNYELPVPVMVPGRGFHSGSKRFLHRFTVDFFFSPLYAGSSFVDNFIEFHSYIPPIPPPRSLPGLPFVPVDFLLHSRFDLRRQQSVFACVSEDHQSRQIISVQHIHHLLDPG